MPGIDLHWHYLPASYARDTEDAAAPWGEQLRVTAGGAEMRVGDQWYPLPPALVDPDLQLAELDARGLDGAVVSPSPNLYHDTVDAALAAPLHRRVNDDIATLVAGAPGRLWGLGIVPLQDPLAAADELRRGVDELGLVGAEIPSNVGGRNLDDEAFDPFFAAAASRRAVLFLHPYRALAPERLAGHYLSNLVGIPVETTVAVACLLLGGVLERHPDLRLVLAHGGGCLSALLGRWDHGWHARPDVRDRASHPPSAFLSQIWVDALTHDRGQLAHLIDLVGAARVVLGSDMPFDMGQPTVADDVAELLADEPAARDRCLAGNARQLIDDVRRSDR